MSYTIHFYDKDVSSITITDDQAARLKAALITGVQWAEIGDDLRAASSISAVVAIHDDRRYKTVRELGMPDLSTEGRDAA